MMNEPTSDRAIELNDQTTLNYTLNLLLAHLKLSADGSLCKTEDLLRMLIAAAAEGITIEAACAKYQDAPSSNTVRSHLNQELLPEVVPQLEGQCNSALAAVIPPKLHQKSQEMATDFHDVPYYGKADEPKAAGQTDETKAAGETDQENTDTQEAVNKDAPEAIASWICRGEARDGTTRFLRCATVYVMKKDKRITLAMTFVKPSDSVKDVLARLITRVRELGFRIRRLYADKGFCATPVIRWLQEHHVRTLIAVAVRGKKGGTRSLCHGEKSYRTTYTFSSAQYGDCPVDVAVVRAFNQRRNGEKYLTWLLYVCIEVDDTPQWIHNHYRRRFGIESSYRLLEQVRARTTSNNPALRFLYMGLAALIGNAWIVLHWTFLRCRGQEPERVARELFTLQRMSSFLTHAIGCFYGVLTTVTLPSGIPATSSAPLLNTPLHLSATGPPVSGCS